LSERLNCTDAEDDDDEVLDEVLASRNLFEPEDKDVRACGEETL
jgi:hypothetical protein